LIRLAGVRPRSGVRCGRPAFRGDRLRRGPFGGDGVPGVRHRL